MAETGLASMTGQGSGHAAFGASRVVVELRSVNHKALDVRLRMAPELSEHSAAVEDRLRKTLGRGRVEALTRVEGSAGAAAIGLDEDRARAAIESLRRLRDELAPGEALPLGLLASVPDLFGARPRIDAEAARVALLAATDDACAALWAMRRTEGTALAADLTGNLAALRAGLATVEARVPAAVAHHKERLEKRIAELLDGVEKAVDPGRLEQEIAFLADRSDVSEEVTRLHSHAGQLDALLNGGAEPIGRQLDFLLQEVNREVNTIGSKSSDATLAQTVVSMKTAVSRMREQAANVL